MSELRDRISKAIMFPEPEDIDTIEQLVNQEVVKALDSIEPVTEWQPKSPFNINRSTGYNDALKDYNRCIAKLRATYTQDTSK